MKKRLEKKWKTYLVVCLGVIAIIGLAYAYARETPRYSLFMLKRALLSKDMDSIERYADLDAIVDSILDKFLYQSEGALPSGPDDSPKRKGSEILRQILPRLKKDLKPQLKRELLSYLDDAKFRNSVSRMSVLLLEIEVDGPFAKVYFQDKERMAMKKTSRGYWQVMKVFLD